jgi:predicted transcriptional regulator
MKKVLLALLLSSMVFGLEVGQKPKEVVISGDNGGLVSGGAWDSNEIKNKVYVMFYVDPDEKDKNEHFVQALKKKHYDRSKYGSIAVVNMAATWKPNFVIEKILASKQKEFKDTIYVKDKKSVLVKKWNLADDNSDIVIFDKDGVVVFYKAGKMSEEDMQKAFEIIEENI